MEWRALVRSTKLFDAGDVEFSIEEGEVKIMGNNVLSRRKFGGELGAKVNVFETMAVYFRSLSGNLDFKEWEDYRCFHDFSILKNEGNLIWSRTFGEMFFRRNYLCFRSWDGITKIIYYNGRWIRYISIFRWKNWNLEKLVNWRIKNMKGSR